MLNGKELILATKPYAKEIRSKSWWYMLSTLFLLLLSLIGTIILPYLPLKIVSSIFAGLFTSRMFVIYHDFLHHSILHKSYIATGIMTTFGIYMLAPTSIWKRSHDYHHKHNCKLFSANIGSYPIISIKKYETLSPSQQRAYLRTRHPLVILLGYFSMFLVGMCFRSFKSSPGKHIDSLVAIIVHVVASALVFWYFGWLQYLLTVFIPFFIPGALGAYLFYAQHNFPGVTFAENCDWNYENAALASSSFMKMSPFMNYMTANIAYHHIHHLNSRIPFYRLPEAMKAIPELQNPKTTKLCFKDAFICMKLKCWDAELNKMVGIK